MVLTTNHFRLLSLISFIANDEHEPNAILLIGAAGAGPIAATARAIAGSVIDIAFIDTKGFRFADKMFPIVYVLESLAF